MKRAIFCSMALTSLLLASCSSSPTPTSQAPDVPAPTTTPENSAATEAPATPAPSATEVTVAFELTSEAFANGQSIPSKYSCVGKDISPALTWSEPPDGAQSFALIMDDPDAPGGTWVHWVLFNIPADTRDLPEDAPITGKNVAPNAIYVGKNSWGKTEYGGPCPPSGTHRYFFKLYALDTIVSLLPGATKEQVLKEIEGHVLAQAELMGTFSK